MISGNESVYMVFLIPVADSELDTRHSGAGLADQCVHQIVQRRL